MKALVTGASGQAGRALAATAPAGTVIAGHDLDTLDITDRDAVASVVAEEEPDVLINTAAYTDVEAAEANVELATRVNADGARNVAEAADRHGIRLLHISTDYVFAGDLAHPRRPTDPTEPLNVYGVSKLTGERAVAEVLGSRCCIIRTSWLYYQHGKNFVNTMLKLMQERGSVSVVSDQIGAPTWAGSLAGAIWAAIEREAAGVHHWRDDGVASWYDFARAIADIARHVGLLEKAVDVVPVTSAEFPTQARRPQFSLLDIEASAKAFGMRPGHWRNNLRTMLEQLAA